MFGTMEESNTKLSDLLPKNDKGDEWVSPFYYEDVFKYLKCVSTLYPTGSYYICDPQVTTTDKDFVVLISTTFVEADTQLEAAGYKYSSIDQDEYDVNGGGSFRCYRKGDVNLIVTDCEDMYNKWQDATELAKAMKLNNKEQRIRLFQYVLYGNTTLKGEIN